jgi:hypothetical protein
MRSWRGSTDHDVARRIHQPARALRHLAQTPRGFRVGPLHLAAHQLAHHRDARQRRAQVVVQVGGDAGADTLHGQEARDAHAIGGADQRDQGGGRRRAEPRSRHERRLDAEAHLRLGGIRRLRRLHAEAVVAGLQAAVAHRAFGGGRAPFPVDAVQPVAEPRRLAPEVEREEVDLEAVLLGSQPEGPDLTLSDRRHRHPHAGDQQPFHDGDRRRDRWPALGHQPGHAFPAAEPQLAA